jgi:hypothetical protein
VLTRYLLKSCSEVHHVTQLCTAVAIVVRFSWLV